MNSVIHNIFYIFELHVSKFIFFLMKSELMCNKFVSQSCNGR